MNSRRSLLWSLSTVLFAGLVAFGAARIAVSPGEPLVESESSFHHWLHTNLDITEEQELRLLPIERAFEDKRKAQRLAIEEAGQALAKAIRVFDVDSPEIVRAHEELLLAQGELQRITLDHFFAMKKHLSPEQGEKLLQWTHDSIIHGRHH